MAGQLKSTQRRKPAGIKHKKKFNHIHVNPSE